MNDGDKDVYSTGLALPSPVARSEVGEALRLVVGVEGVDEFVFGGRISSTQMRAVAPQAMGPGHRALRGAGWPRPGRGSARRA